MTEFSNNAEDIWKQMISGKIPVKLMVSLLAWRNISVTQRLLMDALCVALQTALPTMLEWELYLQNGVFWDVTPCGSYKSHTA
jgi:hypothetical protein